MPPSFFLNNRIIFILVFVVHHEHVVFIFYIFILVKGIFF